MLKRISPSMIVALIALFFALSGGAYAANKYVITSTKQIKPSVLAQLKGRNGTNGVNGANGASGTNGTPGANGANGATGPAGPPGSAAPTAGTLPDVAMTVGEPDKTVGSVGSFALKLSCARFDEAHNMSDWALSSSFYSDVSDVGYFGFGSSELYKSNADGTVYGLADFNTYGDAWSTSGGRLYVTANMHLTQTGCTASNIKTYLTQP